MAQQRMYTVSVPGTLKFAIVWTRSLALARSWACDKWLVDPVLVGAWPTQREDQGILEKRGDTEHYA